VGRYDAELRILEEEVRGFLVLSCVGTLVEETSSRLAGAAKHVVLDGPRSLAIDLSGVSYMSSVGISALLEIRRLTEQHGVRVAVFGAKPEILRLFRYTALDEIIEHFTTQEEALGYLAAKDGGDKRKRPR